MAPQREQRHECGAELTRHKSVEDKVRGGVYQGQQVHGFAEGRIAGVEEALLHNAGQQAEDALRELGDQEQGQHGHQQQCGAVGATIAPGNTERRHREDRVDIKRMDRPVRLPLSISPKPPGCPLVCRRCRRCRCAAIALQLLFALRCLTEHLDQSQANDSQDAAGQQLNYHRMHPKVDPAKRKRHNVRKILRSNTSAGVIIEYSVQRKSEIYHCKEPMKFMRMEK